MGLPRIQSLCGRLTVLASWHEVIVHNVGGLLVINYAPDADRLIRSWWRNVLKSSAKVLPSADRASPCQ